MGKCVVFENLLAQPGTDNVMSVFMKSAFIPPPTQADVDAGKVSKLKPFVCPFWVVRGVGDTTKANMKVVAYEVQFTIASPAAADSKDVNFKIKVPCFQNTVALTKGDELLVAEAARKCAKLSTQTPHGIRIARNSLPTTLHSSLQLAM